VALPDDLAAVAKAVSNWGRWGDDDERGTLNLVTPEAVRRGAAAVRTGTAFPLALPFDRRGPQDPRFSQRPNPVRTLLEHDFPYGEHPSVAHSSDDMVVMGLAAGTHWDSLAHVSYDGQIFNGFPAATITAEAGASRCGIDRVGALATRGVLLDVARARGVEHLAPGDAVTAEDLDAAVAVGGLEVESGDVVLVRTGVVRLFLSGDRSGYFVHMSGLDVSTVEWFHDRDAAAVALDNLNFEVLPGSHPDLFLPVHMLCLRDMGMLQGQNWNLEELAAACAGDGVYAFWLDASPVPFTGGLGAPVQPVAVK
jgi:kynurenine formamidase